MSDTSTEAQAPEDKGPADVDTKVATGYAAYDLDLERYVGPVHRPATSAGKADAQSFADARQDDDGHSYRVVRV